MATLEAGLKASVLGMVVNTILAIVKITAGWLGNSYALIADGVESAADIFSSMIVWGGLRIAATPPDEGHPYGHGKAESVAGLLVAIGLLVAASLLAWHSILEILTPHHAPAWYTLVVLLVVIVIKQRMFRFVSEISSSLESSALRGDAWHHLSDALTSAAAFVGISIALIGGPGFESADDWAALFACAIIGYNGVHLLGPAIDEVMDRAAPDELHRHIRELASGVEHVKAIDKCRIRKSGLGYHMDIHVQVDGDMSVRDGHRVTHEVKDRLMAAEYDIRDVVVHLEPRD